jgi:hypothetical protein
MNETPRYKASMPLQTEFVTNADSCGDHIFKQIRREGDVCAYSRTSVETGKIVGYEVFLVKTVKAGTVFAKGSKPTENDYESYPGKSSFGRSAWSFITTKQVSEKIEELLKGKCQETVLVPVMSITQQMEKETSDIPEGEFSQSQFATMNCLPARGIVYNILQALINKGLVKLARKVQVGPGRPTSMYIRA